MSLLDMKKLCRLDLDRVGTDRGTPDRPGVDDDAERPARRRACDVVDAELGSGRSTRTEPAVAFRSYGAGYLAVGVAGPVDRAMALRVEGLLRDLRPHSSVELLITFTLLESWDPQLARVIGQARRQRLLDGGHLELHHVPADLAAALGPPSPLPVPGPRGPVGRSGDREPCLEQWGPPS